MQEEPLCEKNTRILEERLMTNDILKIIPEMKINLELDEQLRILPDYDANIRIKPIPERLIGLENIYRIYIPNKMSREIYCKLYLALLHSLQKKQTILATKQANENYKRIKNQSYQSILGNSDSFTILGPSGVGKSSAISRSISILTEMPVLEIGNSRIIPFLMIQMPADCSVKGLLFEILRMVDETLNSNYYKNAIKNKRITVDVLISIVSSTLLNHVGLLILDEVQHLIHNKTGKTIIGTITQLINTSGISICMVGTEESTFFFEQETVLARRSIGLSYSLMEYNDDFRNFCKTVLSYCFVKIPPVVDESMLMWIYNHSRGNISIVINLIHDAQEIAILENLETLDITTLNLAYERRLQMLHSFISPPHKKVSTIRKPKTETLEILTDYDETISISKNSEEAKKTNSDVISLLKANGNSITEVLI